MFSDESEVFCSLSWDEKLFQKALLWASGRKRAYFLSPEKRKSPNPNVIIYHCPSLIFQTLAMKKIAKASVFQKIEGSGEIESLKKEEELILSEASDFWVKAVKNARQKNAAYREGMKLRGAFADVPAVVLGAGHSLFEYQDLLPKLSERALIFAGGAALSMIDIKPHFAGAIDVDCPREIFTKAKCFDVPLCYQARMGQEQFSLFQGEKILFPDSSCPWIDRAYRQKPHEFGWSVATFLMEIAFLFGCSPILCIGMDFCYKEGKKYRDFPQGEGVELLEVNGLMTQKDWWAAALWGKGFAEKVPTWKLGDFGLLDVEVVKPEKILQMFPRKKISGEEVLRVLQKAPLKKPLSLKRWDLLEKEKFLLEPLWNIWEPIFAREVQLDPKQDLKVHKTLFFEKVLEDYAAALLPR